MKVIITGSRDWRDYTTILAALEAVGATSVVEGEARGADALARRAAEALGLPVHAHPADWDTHGRAAGMIRNREMLDAHPDAGAVLAFPLPQSVGTIGMWREARARGMDVIPFTPDPAIHPPSSRYDNGYYPADLDRGK